MRHGSASELNVACDNPTVRYRFLPVLSIFAGGLIYAVLPPGAFGTYDVVSRAAIIGSVAGVTCLLILMLTAPRAPLAKRRHPFER